MIVKVQRVKQVARMTAIAAALLLGGCSTSPHVGLGIPAGPVSIGISGGSEGISAVGIDVRHGPLRTGARINDTGEVSTSAGVHASAGPVSVGSSVKTDLDEEKPAKETETVSWSH